MSLIDQATFDELKKISGKDFINELIDAFLEDAPGMIAAMEKAATAGDAETFRRNAHSMKTNANTFGASELGALAKELEMMAKDNNLNAGDKLDSLKALYNRVAEVLKGMRV
jgi:HPt (histidine-containing phosphotransfer) domain-containing protein